jgi:methionine-rich copper-binding protein CopC
MKKILIAAAAVCVVSQAAFAHAFLDHASPAVGSEVSGSPPALDLTYTEPVEPLFSTVQVTDASGVRVDDGKPTTQDDGRILVVKLKTLAPGTYNVAWHVTSVDTHKTEGHFTFSVKP